MDIDVCFDIQHNIEKNAEEGIFEVIEASYVGELRAKSKVPALLSLAVRVLIYSLGIMNWHQEELQKLDRKTRKLLTIHGQHHPKAEVDRLYVLRKERGRCLMQLEADHTVEITKLVEYVDRKEDPLIQVVRTHQHNTDSLESHRARCLKTEVQKETRKIKDSIVEKTKER